MMKTKASRLAFVASFVLAGCGSAFQAAPDTADADTSGTGGGGGTGGSSAGTGGAAGVVGTGGSSAGTGGAAGVGGSAAAGGSAATGGSAAAGDAGANDAGVSTLTVTMAGNGTGSTVTSTPTGINCPGDCSEAYILGQTITLTAAASAGSSFTGWSGGGCSGTGTCTVSMSAATAVTATFSKALACTTVSNVLNCTDGTLAEIKLGQIGATACHDQCQVSMLVAGMTSGCWILAEDTNCYCRSGVLNLGSTYFGGTCK